MNTTLRTTRIGDSAALWGLIQRFHRRDPWLTRVGLLLLLMLVPSYLASLVDPRLFDGSNVWVKPVKFQLSVGLYLITIAWFMAYTRPEFQNSRQRWWLSGFLVTAALYEVLYITLQGALGQASHFNESDALHGILYSLMGVGALTLTTLVVWQGVEVARHRTSPLNPMLRWSIVIGLIATFVLTTIAGFSISTLDGPIVGMARPDTTGIWLFGWAREAGDLRVAHFIGTHAMHVLPLIGWLLKRMHTKTAALVFAAAVSLYLLLWNFTYWQALAGVPLLG